MHPHAPISIHKNNEQLTITKPDNIPLLPDEFQITGCPQKFGH